MNELKGRLFSRLKNKDLIIILDDEWKASMEEDDSELQKIVVQGGNYERFNIQPASDRVFFE